MKMQKTLRALAVPALALLTCCVSVCNGLANGVGRTPAMGWNSWNTFRCNINETLIKQVADAVVTSGLRDAGYRYINIDDCWQQKRDADGKIVPFADKFPSGMKALADYIHSQGLLFGVYSDTGPKTCEGYPGSWGHETQDAQTYAEWGVDYLKFDYCAMETVKEPAHVTYGRMRDALHATGRPILFSICNWGAQNPHLWGNKTGNSWRTGRDVFAVWEESDVQRLKLPGFLQSIMSAVRQQEALHPYASPGAFNDPDMLVVGLEGMYPYGIVEACPEHVKPCHPGMYISRERWGQVGGLTVTEQRSHFALWCMMAAPLILGNDPRRMTRATLDILTAPEVIAVNQDPLGRQGHRVRTEGGVQLWRKPLADGSTVLMLLNTGSAPVDGYRVVWADTLPDVEQHWLRQLPAPEPDCQDRHKSCRDWAASGECGKNAEFMLQECKSSCPAACPKPEAPPPVATALVRDLWQREDLGRATGGFTATHLEPHESRLYRVAFFDPTSPASSAEARDAVAKWVTATTKSRPGAGSHAADSPEVARLRAELAATKLELDAASSSLFSLRAEVKSLTTKLGAGAAGGSNGAAGASMLSSDVADGVPSGKGPAGANGSGRAAGAQLRVQQQAAVDVGKVIDAMLVFGCCATALVLFVMARARRLKHTLKATSPAAL